MSDELRKRPSAVDLCGATTALRIAADAGTALSGLEYVLDADVPCIDSKQRAALEAAWRSSRRMLRVAEDLRDVALADAGLLVPGSDDCDLGRVAAAAVEQSWPVARAARKHIELDVAGRPRANADRALLSRAVHALLEHAVGYAREGTTVSVCVSEGALTLAFEAESSPLEDLLGLALASAFAKLHGGRLYIEPGDGIAELFLTFGSAELAQAA